MTIDDSTVSASLMRRDRYGLTLAILAFSLTLGSAAVVFPLLVLEAGYGPEGVGLLTAIAAIAQLVARASLPWLLARYPDRRLSVIACALMAISYGLLLVSSSLPVFIVSQLFHGTARAVFWTSSQTHAVRGQSAVVKSVAQVTALANLGTLTGPAIAGLIVTHYSMPAAVAASTITATVALVAALGLRHLDPYQPVRPPGQPRIWRRPGVDLACWSSVTAGGWRGIMSSYVPVILDSAGLRADVIGVLVAMGDTAGIVATSALARMGARRIGRLLDLAVLGTAFAIISLPIAGGHAIIAGLLISIGGAANGTITTLAISTAVQQVDKSEQGEAIALTGTFRAAALFSVPSFVALSLAPLGLAPAVAIVGTVIALPPLALGQVHRFRKSREQASDHGQAPDSAEPGSESRID